MTDLTSNPPTRTAHERKCTTEYRVYFTLIFLLALPFETVRWMRDVFRFKTLNMRGPMARAWAEAERTTPMIFSV
jgi:hypothetical protein